MTTQTDVIQTALTALYPLSEEQRLDARDKARHLVKRKHPKPDRAQYNTAGPMPTREQFEESHISEYPRWVTRTIGVMLLIAFIGAFATSAFSVFSAGRNHYVDAMGSGAGIAWQAVVVGVAIVLLAEFLTITSVLAGRIYFRGKRLWQIGMILPAAAGVVIAVTANAVISQPVGWWQWLVTVAPPVSVVFLAVIGEQIILSDVKRHHANERSYQAALKDWKIASRADDEAYTQDTRAWEATVNAPEQSPEWRATYAGQLREAVKAINAKGRGRGERVEFMQTMPAQAWSAVVQRELKSDSWFNELPQLEDVTASPFGVAQVAQPQVEVKPVATIAAPQPVTVSTNGNGHKTPDR